MSLAGVMQFGVGVVMILPLIFFQDFFDTAGNSQSTGMAIDMKQVSYVCQWLVYLSLIMMVLFFFAFLLSGFPAINQKAEWKKRVIKSILRQDIGWFDVSHPEELASKMSEGITRVYKAVDSPSYMVFQGIGMGLGGFVFGFIKDWYVAICTFAVVPLLVVFFGLFLCTLWRSSKVTAAAYNGANGLATEALFSMRTIASLSIEKDFATRYKQRLTAAAVAQAGVAPLKGFTGGLAQASFMLLLMVGFLSGGFLVADEMDRSSYTYSVTQPFYPYPGANATMIEIGYCADDKNTPAEVLGLGGQPCPAPYQSLQMNCLLMGFVGSMGDSSVFPGSNMSFVNALGHTTIDEFEAEAQRMAPEGFKAKFRADGRPLTMGCYASGAAIIIVVFAIMNGGQGFGNLLDPASKVGVGLGAAANLHQILARKSAVDPFSEDGERPDGVTGDIEIRDVVFAYPSAIEHLVCKGYSLRISAGQTVALCGASGSGKSTIIQLLERFYDPQSGALLLDGRDIKTLNVRWLRSKLGLVGQEPVLFQGSVATNIAYGKTDATREEIEAAARMANAHDFIMKNLNDGYDTDVGLRGGKLSGGQKQRVAIARAIVKKPAVLLLDEATSALDNESERIVQAALDEIMSKQKRTTIVIAHRLSTIRNADKIAVVSEGKVVEEGTYDELLKLDGGLFHKLAQRQQEMGAKDMKTMDAARAAASSNPLVGLTALPSYTASAVKDRKGRNSKERRNSKEMVTATAEESTTEASMAGGIEVGSPMPVGMTKAVEKNNYISQVLRLQTGSLWALGLGCLFAMGTGASPLVGFYYIVDFFGALFQLSGALIRAEVARVSITILIICAIMVICFTLDSGFFGLAAARLTATLRRHAFDAFLRQDIGFFDLDSNSAGDLTSFLAEKVTLMESLTGGSAQAIVRVLASLVSMLVLVFWFGPWQLALFLFGAVPVIMCVMGVMITVLAGDEIKAQKGQEVKSAHHVAERSAGKLLSEVVLSIRTVASFNAEERFYNEFVVGVDRIRALEAPNQIKIALAMACSIPMMMYVFAAMYYYLGYLISQGDTTFEKGMLPLFAMMGVLMPVIAAATGVSDITQAKNAAKRYFESVNRKTLIDPFSEDGERPDSVTGDIEIRDVVFAYPSAIEHLVCKGYSLRISAGQTVALCGASGSGKSTIIQLLERFYDPQSGALLLDGRDIKTLNVRWLRSKLGLVGQEPVLFQGSVATNIAYGKTDATREEIEAAARMANAHDFIMKNLNDGYDTDVGLRGGKLSGGQKQRVAIARAIVKKPAVLLLDEATSALDNESERIVQAALDEIMSKQKRTTIVIAHRLSTIRNADKIAVVSEGKVVEEGTHTELLGNVEGLYFNLVLAQSH